MQKNEILDVDVKPPLARWIPLSFQHVFAMFGATVLVPLLTGLSPSTALFTAGIGTLLYILVTGAKVPAFLGSSFAFIPAIAGIAAEYGMPYALGGAFCVGLLYTAVAAVIKVAGKGWIDRALPPVVIGAVIVVIGLNLAPTAMDMAMNATLADGTKVYSIERLIVALVTLGIAVVGTIVFKGFFNTIPILIGLVGGYLFTLAMGAVNPAFRFVDFAPVAAAPWISLPGFAMPKFAFVPIVTFLLVSLATIAEHLGDTLVTSKVVGRDFYKDPGLHRTLLGDGLATSLAALFGGPPNTTYGENIGVMAITRVYSVWVIGGAAVVAVLLSFVGKFGALIQTMPVPVMGGISMLLFGIIASSGIRTLVESGVDYSCKRNLTISSVILTVGIGGGRLFFPVTDKLSFDLKGVALATLVGILLNLVLPKGVDAKKAE